MVKNITHLKTVKRKLGIKKDKFQKLFFEKNIGNESFRKTLNISRFLVNRLTNFLDRNKLG